MNECRCTKELCQAVLLLLVREKAQEKDSEWIFSRVRFVYFCIAASLYFAFSHWTDNSNGIVLTANAVYVIKSLGDSLLSALYFLHSFYSKVLGITLT